MQAVLNLNLPATLAGLQAASVAIEDSCLGWGLTSSIALRARLVIEELVSNTIKYGYGCESDCPFRVRAVAEPVLTIYYEDDAPLFDPTSCTRKKGTLAIDQPEGNIGMSLITGLTTSLHFERRQRKNVLVLTLSSGPEDDTQAKLQDSPR